MSSPRKGSQKMAMNIPMTKWNVAFRARKNLLAGALLLTGAVGGWGFSTFADRAVAVESHLDVMNNHVLDNSKLGLVGTYLVNGTDAEGKPYPAAVTLDISLRPPASLA